MLTFQEMKNLFDTFKFDDENYSILVNCYESNSVVEYDFHAFFNNFDIECIEEFDKNVRLNYYTMNSEESTSSVIIEMIQNLNVEVSFHLDSECDTCDVYIVKRDENCSQFLKKHDLD